MSGIENFAEAMMAWAAREPAVQAVVSIGSRVRRADDLVWWADAQSDWDFQVITAKPGVFANAGWTRGIPGADVRAYAARTARIGGVPKINAIFRDAEVDFVVLPAGPLRALKFFVRLGLHRREGRVRRALQDLAVVIRPGWRFLKGAETWEPFYRRVVAEVPDARLTDETVRQLAEGFVCDYVWTRRKLERGELLAAQRMLHRELAETNFRLLHELKLRRGERSFPEGRRIERVANATELAGASVDSRLEAAAVRAAADKSAATCRDLTRALVGDTWHWPDV